MGVQISNLWMTYCSLVVRHYYSDIKFWFRCCFCESYDKKLCVKHSYSTDHYSLASNILIGLEFAKSPSSLQVWPPNLRYHLFCLPARGFPMALRLQLTSYWLLSDFFSWKSAKLIDLDSGALRKDSRVNACDLQTVKSRRGSIIKTAKTE